MTKHLLFICLFLPILGFKVKGQIPNEISINFIKKQNDVLPDQIVNIPLFIKNNNTQTTSISLNINLPKNWNIITSIKPAELKALEQKFSVFSLQIPPGYPVGEYPVSVNISDANTGNTINTQTTTIKVKEIENVSIQLIEAPEHILAGDLFKSAFLLKNLGNTTKKVFIETSNCDVEGNADLRLAPGESHEIKVIKPTADDLGYVSKQYYTVRTIISGKVTNSIFRSYIIFPVKNSKKDLFFRLPVNFSATYLASNQEDRYKSTYQIELSGNGSLDPAGKHQIEFLARGPNSSNLSYLGMYDQYYLSYANKNVEFSIGEKSYSFTPLTESSRFGMGVENSIIFNNGLSFGFLYVKPRFYKDIANELAFYSKLTDVRNKKNRLNSVELFYVLKKNEGIEDLTYLTSINSTLQPFERTTLEFEASKGASTENSDYAFRTNINTLFSIFRAAGSYFYVGKNYPGYYSNSTFYSGTVAAQIAPKLNVGIYARQDFRNAQLDTFFVTAPFSKSLQSFVNYNIASRSHLKLYWREYERKDRLVQDKFHYKTRSLNTRYNQKFKKTEFTLLGEYGNTTNYLVESVNNKQVTYRGSANISYRFNSLNAVRVFGSWSNINSFVSGEQRNLTAGLSVNTQLFKNLKANFQIQNAYDIDDYYRNRNLMQLNLDYKFLKTHKITLRSYYTIFRQQTENPEFTFSATYSFRFGMPVKQVKKAGDIRGRITDIKDQPLEGVILNLLDKRAISNNNGEFWFKSIQPGIHLLTVDRSKFGLDELPSIPTPLEIEVVEDEVSLINFKIVKGSKLTGGFILNNENIPGMAKSEVSPKNIIVQLKSDFKEYRITSDQNGNFSFPIVRPGKWILKIYTNSLPPGYEIEKDIYNLQLSPGDSIFEQIELKQKKRNIIFKSQNFSLSTSGTLSNKPVKLQSTPEIKKENSTDSTFYSIQIGAFGKSQKPNSRFLRDIPFYFEKQINNLYKYFVGRYDTYEQASIEKEKLKARYRGAFIVVFKNNKLNYLINEQKK